MDELSNHQKAVELLQQLGFKEYEAKCFVALSRLPKGTAKEISATSDVPRTRVYDAIRVLETRGLVEVQHSNPQQFRAVPIDEAVDLLRREYESRAETLTDALEHVEPAPVEESDKVTHDVWAITGSDGIATRMGQLIDDARDEVVLVIGLPNVFSEELADQLRAKEEAGVDVVVGMTSDTLRDEVQTALPNVDVYTSGLEWLEGSPADPHDSTTISRLLLVDRNTILISSILNPGTNGTEKAVFGRGFDNGIVVIARRMMATGLYKNRESD